MTKAEAQVEKKIPGDPTGPRGDDKQRRRLENYLKGVKRASRVKFCYVRIFVQKQLHSDGHQVDCRVYHLYLHIDQVFTSDH